MSSYIGRFAPSPTGPLHLGSLAIAVASYLDARIHHGQWLVRIEDTDENRCHPEWAQLILHTLQAHGLNWDQEVIIQSKRYALYETTLQQFNALGLTYPCACSRQEIEQANNHRQPGQNRIYPGTCRAGHSPLATVHSIRFRVPREAIEWYDYAQGVQHDFLETSTGDFVIHRGDGFWSYHLAGVVDDLSTHVTHIVRGQDLSASTARQVALMKALQNEPPKYWHLPLVMDKEGKKLSKQNGAPALQNEYALHNLHAVGQHFGLPKINANSCNNWLQQAIVCWAQFAKAQTLN